MLTIYDAQEIFLTIALVRIILPKKAILFAGGEENALGMMEKITYEPGANGSMVENYFTTEGMEMKKKVEMFKYSSRYHPIDNSQLFN